MTNKFHAPLAAVAIAVVAAGAGYFFGLRQAPAEPAVQRAVTPSAASITTAPAEAAGRKVLYWHDPMVPGKRFDKPGKSPFMELVPVMRMWAKCGRRDAPASSRVGVCTVVATEGTLDYPPASSRGR
jgi:hypothetical protein